MTNSAKLIRLVKIMSLIDRRQGATLQHIVDECGVCPRTGYRDIEALAEGELTVVYVATPTGFALKAVRLGPDHGAAGVEVLAGLGPDDRVALDPVRAGLSGARAAGGPAPAAAASASTPR